jgi:hypothetical protein
VIAIDTIAKAQDWDDRFPPQMRRETIRSSDLKAEWPLPCKAYRDAPAPDASYVAFVLRPRATAGLDFASPFAARPFRPRPIFFAISRRCSE